MAGRPTLQSKALRDRIYERFNGCCLGCGGTLYRHDGWEIHHVIPRPEGGSDDMDNLAALCTTCHTKAEDMRPVPQTLWALRKELRFGMDEPLEVPEKFAGSPQSLESSCEDWNLDWRKWVYGGHPNPFKDARFLAHRVACPQC